MYKQIFIIFSLFFSLIAKSEQRTVLNVFYEGSSNKLFVNTITTSNRSGYFRTEKIRIITNQFLACNQAQGCPAKIIGISHNQFSIRLENGQFLASVGVIDRDFLLPREAFSLLNNKLILDLNKLSQSKRVFIQ